tara:strand:- start:35 stop:463 length:429 start_codon:yes stop_codon:yes gene_type:complete
MSLTPSGRKRREEQRRMGNDPHVDEDCCSKCCIHSVQVCAEKCDCSKCKSKSKTKVHPLTSPTTNVMQRGGRRTRKKRKRRSMCARLTNKACKSKRYKKRCKTTRRKKRGSKGRKSHCRTRKNRFAKRPNRKRRRTKRKKRR